ncbi:hypothetical protein ACWKWU_06020 [Chitinophaga lutea]
MVKNAVLISAVWWDGVVLGCSSLTSWKNLSYFRLYRHGTVTHGAKYYTKRTSQNNTVFMAFRNYTEDFPFYTKDKAVWYFIIDWVNRTQSEFYNVSGKKELVKELKKIIDNGDEKNYELLGVWNGMYSTDIFKIPIREGYFELNQHFSY